jgi:hypothetical protein
MREQGYVKHIAMDLKCGMGRASCIGNGEFHPARGEEVRWERELHGKKVLQGEDLYEGEL